MVDDDQLAPAPVPFEYAVLRLVPRVDRGEFINAGVVMYCQAREFLGCASDLDQARVTALFPALDLTVVRDALAAACAVCDGDAVAGLAGAESLRARFGWLIAPRSTVLQAGPVHSGLTTDPQADLGKLLERLVHLPGTFS